MPANEYIRVPQDQAGKRQRHRSRDLVHATEGTLTFHEQYVIAISERVTTGIYYYQTGAHVVLATAQGTTVNFWGLFNNGSATGSPTGGVQYVALRGIDFRSQHGSALATVTSPRLALQRGTFTSGIGGGTAITPARRDSTDAAPYSVVRLAATATGLAIVADVIAWLPVSALTAVGAAPPAESDWEPAEVGQLVLRPGECALFRQLDAGTASDTRRFLTALRVEEFYLP